MNRIIKIKENYIFRRAYRKGTGLVCPYAVVYVLGNKRGSVRLGITAGKKLGTAVMRNRAKRVIYAAFRGCLPRLLEGFDFIIVARTRILTAKSNQVEEAFLKLFRGADILKPDEEIVD